MKAAILLVGFLLLACWFGVAIPALKDAFGLSLEVATAFAVIWAFLSIVFVIWYESPGQRKKRAERRAREFRA